MGDQAITLPDEHTFTTTRGMPLLEVLYREHHERVFLAAYRVSGSIQDAEDVLQSVFLRLLKQSRNQNLGSAPERYLCRAAINSSLDVLRARRRGPGITGLVGPNGSGKSTMMNLIAGLMRPNRGRIEVLGLTVSKPEIFYRQLGYCTQYDSFPAGMTGHRFVQSILEIHGYSNAATDMLTQDALQRVDLLDAAHRPIAAYSKGMRQRIKLAQAICHRPKVLILDEPLNGLDPMARAQVIALFRELADAGASLIISSHILHEVDLISDRVVLLNSGYLVAEGDVEGIKG
ncbi:MAG: ATP-binding cassette domain-containing protein [bacterium]|nr:ATP-binding cassette domain-containing protein [Gammaproteobacteria bacterium]HIL96571.1 ATP-binding cassette domain-containing protein [Pseudomonadales bacterium]